LGAPLIFGYIGQIAIHKGVDLLVEAFVRLGEVNAELQIFGPEDQSPAYMAALRSAAEGKRVCFRGTFPGERMAEILAGMDVLVIPSRWYENSPLVLLYALASHTPVILADVAGLTEFIETGKEGFSFARGSVDALESVIRRFVNEPELAGLMSATTHYQRTTSTMVEDVLAVYHYALEAKCNP
jgi:glycosyltransferase involved in cell wall biosynthesis